MGFIMDNQERELEIKNIKLELELAKKEETSSLSSGKIELLKKRLLLLESPLWPSDEPIELRFYEEDISSLANINNHEKVISQFHDLINEIRHLPTED